MLSVQKCAPEAEVCDPPPHIYAVDDISYPRKKLLVVGSGKALEGYEQKHSYTFSGKLAYWSPDMRFIKLDGLLVLDEPPPPPPSEEKK
ncbi:MAG: hypothetical protein FJ088_10945 [Deltaproteobacteria bacterium]|nr:hypothetical protein [Deltaproteobacteria bacterium]